MRVGAPHTGLAVTGSWKKHARGNVRNLKAHDLGHGEAWLSFDFESCACGDYYGGLYIDGALTTRRAPATGAAPELWSGDMTAGDHELDVRTLRDWDDAPTISDGAGSRARMTWSMGPSGIAAYRLYWDEGAGGAADTLLAEISGIAITETRYRRAASGTGHGRVSFGGNWSMADAAVNEMLRATITGDGTFSWTLGALYSGTDVFAAGECVPLLFGATIEFHDDAAMYHAGDIFETPIGPPRSFLTDDLGPGSYQFAVSVVDGYGNESGRCAPKTISVTDLPEPVTGAVAQSWDADAGEMTAAFAWNSDWDTVNVYSNYNTQTQSIDAYVMEHVPHAVLTAGEWTFAPGDATGTLKYYLRPVADGIELPDITMHEFAFPPAARDLGIVLNVPAELTLTAQGGDILAEWDYLSETGDGASRFDVRWTSGENEDVAIVDAADGIGFPVKHYCVTFTPGSDGTWSVSVLARAASGLASATITGTVTIMTEAPVYAGAMGGGIV